MSREIFDTYNQEDYTYHAADESINSETMEKKDPAINQHEEDSRGIHSNTADSYENTTNSASPNVKDDGDDDWDNDANRRTLDEEKADEDEDEIE